MKKIVTFVFILLCLFLNSPVYADDRGYFEFRFHYSSPAYHYDRGYYNRHYRYYNRYDHLRHQRRKTEYWYRHQYDRRPYCFVVREPGGYFRRICRQRYRAR